MTIQDKILSLSNAPAGSTMLEHIMSVERTLMIPVTSISAEIRMDNIDIDLQRSEMYGNISIDEFSSNLEQDDIDGYITETNIGVDNGT